MVTHIVLWSLKEEYKEEAYPHMKEILEALVGVVPGLRKVTVGKNYNGNECDVCLYSVLEDKKALEGYIVHPAHVEVGKYVRKVVSSRLSCDFECEDDSLDGEIDPFVV